MSGGAGPAARSERLRELMAVVERRRERLLGSRRAAQFPEQPRAGLETVALHCAQ